MRKIREILKRKEICLKEEEEEYEEKLSVLPDGEGKGKERRKMKGNIEKGRNLDERGRRGRKWKCDDGGERKGGKVRNLREKMKRREEIWLMRKGNERRKTKGIDEKRRRYLAERGKGRIWRKPMCQDNGERKEKEKERKRREMMKRREEIWLMWPGKEIKGRVKEENYDKKNREEKRKMWLMFKGKRKGKSDGKKWQEKYIKKEVVE